MGMDFTPRQRHYADLQYHFSDKPIFGLEGKAILKYQPRYPSFFYLFCNDIDRLLEDMEKKKDGLAIMDAVELLTNQLFENKVPETEFGKLMYQWYDGKLDPDFYYSEINDQKLYDAILALELKDVESVLKAHRLTRIQPLIAYTADKASVTVGDQIRAIAHQVTVNKLGRVYSNEKLTVILCEITEIAFIKDETGEITWKGEAIPIPDGGTTPIIRPILIGPYNTFIYGDAESVKDEWAKTGGMLEYGTCEQPISAAEYKKRTEAYKERLAQEQALKGQGADQ
jgi:hypothetical protein